MKIEFSSRGFARGEFADTYGQLCRIQKSSSAEEDRIWLGAYDKGPHMNEVGEMHLNRAQVAALLPHLQAFVNTGSIEATEEAVNAAHAVEAREALASAFSMAAAELEDDGFKGLANALRWLADPTPDETP